MYDREPVVVVDLLCVSPYYDAELVRALNGRGIDAHLAATSFHLDPQYFGALKVPVLTAVIDYVSRRGVRNVRVRRTLKFVEYCWNLYRVLRWISESRTKVVHIQWLPLLDWVDVELLWLSRLRALGCRLVLTVHNVMPHDGRPHRKLSYRRLYNAVDALICHTEDARHALKENFGVAEERIYVIPHGPLLVDYAMSAESVLPEPSGVGGPPMVLCAGTVKPYKGLHFLLEAWSTVHSRQPAAVLVIAGNGDAHSLRGLREHVQRLPCSSSIQLRLGPLSTADVVNLHRRADLVVFPYRAITQSGALMTAMGLGKAIVASDLPGFREYLCDRRGLLVPIDDADAMARAILQVLSDDKLRRELADRAKRATERELSWELIAERTRLCYDSVQNVSD